MARKPDGPLRRGWTTGACATAAVRAAYTALLTGDFPDPVAITLPKGQKPSFALAKHTLHSDRAIAAVVKDAGDDPDVTHGALIVATVRQSPAGRGVVFKAGAGVGIVTRPGLALAVDEPAINPVPRKLMTAAIREVAEQHGGDGNVEIEISIPDGEELAQKTMNGRLGIVGGLSILGTTGIVMPFSCTAWIASIHQGIDIARASKINHVAGSTGNTSEAAVAKFHDLPEQALIDMGDFAGGMLKYLRKHPIAKVTVAGGFAKISKLGMGFLDLHSGRSQVDFDWLSGLASELGGDAPLVSEIRTANTAIQVYELCRQAGLPLADAVAARAAQTARNILGNQGALEILVFDRQEALIGRADG